MCPFLNLDSNEEEEAGARNVSTCVWRMFLTEKDRKLYIFCRKNGLTLLFQFKYEFYFSLQCVAFVSVWEPTFFLLFFCSIARMLMFLPFHAFTAIVAEN